MNYQNVANQLAAQGRGGDTTLVHMSPREVRSLQDLAMAHGGALTTNPNTGLPEAGFLENILPMVVGAGLSMIPGVGPLMAAGIVGGGTALATGDINKGITAGLGAYGGAGLGAGLMGAGTAAAEAALPAAGLPENMGLATQAAQASPFATMGQGLSALGTEAGRAGFMSGVGGFGGLARSGLAAAAPMMAGMGAGEAPQISRSAPLTRLNYEARPVSPMPSPDPGGREQRYFEERYVNTGRPFIPGDFATATPMPGMAAGGQLSLSGTIDVGKTDDSSNGFGQNSAAGYSAAGSGFPFTSSPSAPSDTPLAAPLVSPIETTESSPFQTEPMLPTSYMAYGGMADGGASHLGDYSDGGRMLRGPGDGVSDSIPATIGGKQPARLADGEFVVPARIVSELGNGSSEAGARKLYAMMDRIQSARKKSVGKGKVAVDSKTEKLLPA